MDPAIFIDRATGEIRIDEVCLLTPYAAKTSVEPQVASLLAGSRDNGNGYEWLDLHGLTFGGEEASLSLCFHDGRLSEASWSVQLAGAPIEGDWPTKKEIDSELAFVRTTLAKVMGIKAGKMPWGEVWCQFDARGDTASNGLRYRSA